VGIEKMRNDQTQQQLVSKYDHFHYIGRRGCNSGSMGILSAFPLKVLAGDN
jgi:hypothetical protein